MAGLTVGYIYFLESDAGNQDWIAGGPATIVVGNFTEGTDLCKLEIPEQLRIGFHTGIKVEQGSAGSSYDLRSERRWYDTLANGIETTRANAALVRNFFMLASHTSGDAATFKRYHMVIIYDTATYEPFINDAGTSKDYCTGVVVDGDSIWEKSNPFRAKIRLNWRSVW